MDPKTEQGFERHTLTDVIFFDLEDLQSENSLIPSLPAPSVQEDAPPPRASLSAAIRSTNPSLSPSLSASPRPSRASLSAFTNPSRASLGPPRASLPHPLSLRPSSPHAPFSGGVSARAPSSRVHELSVSILTFATNDAVGLARKLENTLAMCRHSRHKTEIIVGCDGHDQAVLEVARSYEPQGVRVLSSRQQQRVGALTIWAQVTHASRHEVLLFTDVNARMAPETLDRLLAPMRDPDVGMTVPSYVPCIEEAQGVRVRLDAATHGITAASYAGVAVRRRLVRRPAHDTLQPGLAAALQVLSGGHRVVSLPAVRVFHPQINSARESFARIAQHTQAQLQAALRQREELFGARARKATLFAVLRAGLKHIPLLALWLGCTLSMALYGLPIPALLVVIAGALCIARANYNLTRSAKPSRLDRLGALLTAGAAQAYGIVRSLAPGRALTRGVPSLSS